VPFKATRSEINRLIRGLQVHQEHEWLNDGSTGVIGITDYAQNSLGDIVFVELPKVARRSRRPDLRLVESVKAVSDLFAPVSAR